MTNPEMKIGAVYPQTELRGDPDAVRRIGLAAESLGYDYLLAYDHVVGAVHADRQPALMGPYTEHDPFHDPFVMFAYLAGMTERLEFATGVLILPQRQTVLVAKQCADLDLLSGGRLRLGVGVGWNYVEYDALGQPFGRRGQRVDEQIDVLRDLWRGEVTSYDGEFDRLDRGVVLPGPGRQIPIWIGGFSPPAFRRGVARGDGFMFAGKESAVHDALAALRHEADEQQRSLDGFGLEYLALRVPTVDDTAAHAERWCEAGGSHFAAVSMGGGRDSTEAHLDFFADVAERLGLPAGGTR
jgi:probable F420-dependent oxidoreductase